MDLSTSGLRVLRTVAERGSITSAAEMLGFTQSAVSRQVAALEREAGTALFERHPGGTRPTPAGLALLRHARVILDELAAAEAQLTGTTPSEVQDVRLGVYVSAAAALLPDVLARLRERAPDVRVITRDGTTPALTRGVRAGSLDLAVISSRPPHRAPDTELPRLHVDVVDEGGLLIATAATGPLAGRRTVTVEELATVDWVASPGSAGEPLLGVWPGLPGRPRVAHSASDWLTKLRLVQAGFGVTTMPANLIDLLPPGVVTLSVADAPAERRRLLAVRLPGRPRRAAAEVIDAFGSAARRRS